MWVFTQGTVEERRLVAAYVQNGRIVVALAVNAPFLLPAYEALIEVRAPFPHELPMDRSSCALFLLDFRRMVILLIVLSQCQVLELFCH
jgi:hypothetical protein